MKNVKDPDHASRLLHLFHTTFNIFRAGMKARSIADANHGLQNHYHSDQAGSGDGYRRQQNIRSMDKGFALEDAGLLDQIQEFDEMTTNQIQPIFPQLVVQQIHNTLVARQLLPKGPSSFELILRFFWLC